MRIQIAAAVAISAVALAGFSWNGFAGAPAQAAPTTVDLADALVPADEVSERMGTTVQVVSSESGTHPMSNPTTNPANCTVVYAPGSAAGYDGSGYTDIVVQSLRPAGGEVGTSVIEAIAEFPDTKAAQTYLNGQAATWKNCKGTPIIAEYSNGMTADLKAGVVTAGGLELFAMLFTNPMKGSAGCERVLQAKNNYVVDVLLCSDDNPGGKGRSLRSQIVRNLA